MPAIDHIGTANISIRRTGDTGIMISRLDGGDNAKLQLTPDDWFALMTLVHAITGAADFAAGIRLGD